MLLFLSVLALFLGPFSYRLLQRQPDWLDLLDAFIFVTISGLVLFHILPELLHSGGLVVLLLMAVGVFAPSWIEKYFHKAAHQAHQITLFLAILGLVLHASIDGSVLLVDQDDHTGWLLALGVLLHRFPVGLTIWWLLRPQYGRSLPTIILVLMSVMTLVGAFFADYSLAQLDGKWLAWLQAFVMGSIMHVVLHRPYLNGHQHQEKKENRYLAGIGSIAGLIVLASVLLPHWLGYIEHHHQDEHLGHEHHQELADHDHSQHANKHSDGADHDHSLHVQRDNEHHHADELEHVDHEEHSDDADHDHSLHVQHDNEHHHAEELEHANHEEHSDDGDHNHAQHENEHHHDEEFDHVDHEEHSEDANHDHSQHEKEHHHNDTDSTVEASHATDHQAEAQHNTAVTLVNFLNIALYSAPMLLLAYLLSGLLYYFKSKPVTVPMQDSRTFAKDALKGVLYGLPLPVCSPSASKMHQQLLNMGASQTFATAFLIAAPIIGFDALLISWPLLGGQMLLLRIVIAAVFALAIAWIIARHFKAVAVSEVVTNCQCDESTSRFVAALKKGYQHQLDHTAPWVLLGWALAATLSVSPAWAFFDQALWLQVLVMILAAFPFALCATGITPVIAVLLIAGLSPGAALAFLLIAPTISLELLSKIKQQQGIFAAMSLAMLMLGSAFLIALGVDQYIEVITLPWLELQQESYNYWQVGSLLVILVLYLSSLLRRGARSFIAELIPKSLLKVHHHH